MIFNDISDKGDLDYRGFLDSKTEDGVIYDYHQGVNGFFIFAKKVMEEFGISN